MFPTFTFYLEFVNDSVLTLQILSNLLPSVHRTEDTSGPYTASHSALLITVNITKLSCGLILSEPIKYAKLLTAVSMNF